MMCVHPHPGLSGRGYKQDLLKEVSHVSKTTQPHPARPASRPGGMAGAGGANQKPLAGSHPAQTVGTFPAPRGLLLPAAAGTAAQNSACLAKETGDDTDGGGAAAGASRTAGPTRPRRHHHRGWHNLHPGRRHLLRQYRHGHRRLCGRQRCGHHHPANGRDADECPA